MKSFIFLLTLIALISSANIPKSKFPPFTNLNENNEDEYGCVVPEGARECCWIHPRTCCNPHQQDNCSNLRTKCYKFKFTTKDGNNIYVYPISKIIGN